MDLKYFDSIDGAWYDVSGNVGASLEYNDVSGWVTTGGYKKYVAQITQSGTDAPSTIVLENTLGFNPVWEYDSNGVYGFNWDGDFNNIKCINYVSMNYYTDSITWVEYDQAYNITLKTSKGDNNIYQTTLEIRYYN